MTEGPEYAEAEWMSGWIALSFLNDPMRAVDHFNNFYNNVGYPISLSRGAYWLASAYEKMNDKELAFKWYEKASKFLTTYYGQLAFLKIYPNENFSLNEMPNVNEKYKKKFFEKNIVKIVYLLDELNKDKYTKNILKHLANENVEAGSEILAAQLATEISGAFTSTSSSLAGRIQTNADKLNQNVKTDSSVTFGSIRTTGDIRADGDVIANQIIVSSSVTHVLSLIHI